MMIGTTLSHYEIVDKIGVGGMGEVYRARDPRLGRDVALKVIRSELAQRPERVTRFEHEARAVAALNHPNILSVFDVGHEGGIPFLVTEVLEGETLRRTMARGTLTDRKAIEYAAQIADGLAAAHGRGIVHRDLKPENVFITRDGHVKILDFGLAKLIGRDPDNPISTESPTAAMTDTGAVVGTPGYMSPEQLRGGQADHRSDIFALGVVLFEMLSGRKPFSGANAAEISAAILRDEPQPLSDDGHPVPPTVERLVRQCLEKDPGQRFESAHDLAHMLRAVSDTGSVRVMPPMRPPRRRRRLLAAAAAAAAALVVTAVIATRLFDRAAPPALPEVRHIAVLPFEAEGDDPESRFLAAGLAEIVADGLTIVERETRGATWVIPPSPDLTLEEARKTGNATIGVRGVLRPSAERIRLDLELVDPADGRTFIRRTLDEDVRNVTGLQKEPVRLVWEMLGFTPTSAAIEDLEDCATNTVGACRSYVSGRGRLSTASDETELRAAVASLDQAIAEDPGYVPARIARTLACSRIFEITKEDQWKERAIADAEAAITLDDTAVGPYLALADVYRNAGQTELELDALRSAADRARTAEPFMLLGTAATDAGRFDEAERALQTAINLRPVSYEPHMILGYLFARMNRLDAATNEFRHAAQAAPLNQEAHINLGVALYYLERREEAESAFESALALGPHAIAYSNLGTLYFEDGRFGDAAEMFENAVELVGDDSVLVGNLASSEYWGGDRAQARRNYLRAIELAEEDLKIDPDDPVSLMTSLAGYYGMVGEKERGLELLETAIGRGIENEHEMGAVAECFADLGDRDRALEWLGTAIEAGLDLKWVERRPSFNSLRTDPRYREITSS